MINLSLSCHIGWRYARSAKGGAFLSFISFFTVIGVALGVAALITVISVMDGFEQELKNRILGSVPHISIKANNVSIEELRPTITKATQDKTVTQVVPLIEANSIVQVSGELLGVKTLGLADIADVPTGITDAIYSGSWQNLASNKYGIVIGRYLAMEHGLTTGSKVRLMFSGASHYTPIGRMPAQRNFTIVGIFATDSEAEKQHVFVNAAALNRMLKKPTGSNDGIRITLQDAFDAEQVAGELAQELVKINQDYNVEYWQKTHGNLFKAVQMEKNMMAIMLLLIVMVAAFNIVSALVMMVTRKQGEIAILKTQGMTGANLASVFVFQGGYNGIVGAALGAILGIILCLGLNPFMSATSINLLGPAGVGLPIDFSWLKVAVVFGLAVGLSLLASIYPALKAASLKPAQVLRYE